MAEDALSRYRIVKPLPDAGPHVKSFEARQAGLDRAVELRVLNRRVAKEDPAFLRFQREFQALASVDHPAVIKVLDLGAADGRLYYTTDRRDSETLRENLRRRGGSLDPEEALELLSPVTHALQALHRKGILHRDVSLDSIRVDTRSGRAYLATFSLLKVLRLPSLTERGFKVPESGAAYTPELAEGWKESSRTDVFLLGTVFYQALTGRPLPTPAEVLGGAAAAFEVPPPSEARIGLDPVLDDIVMACLAYDPAKRLTSVKALLERLDRVQRRLAAKDVARTTGLRAVGAPGDDPEAEAEARRRRNPRRRRRQVASADAASGLMNPAGLAGVLSGRDAHRRGLFGIFAVLGCALFFAYSGGTGGAAPGPSRIKYRKAKKRPKADLGSLSSAIRDLAREAVRRPTSPKTFEVRWGTLRAFVKALPKATRLERFPPSEMANLRIAFFNDREAACRTLDSLIEKARQVSDRLRASDAPG